MRIKYLLGATADRELVFGEFETEHPHLWSKEKGSYVDTNTIRFSASFCTVTPFKGDDVDLVKYYENFVDDIGKETAYDLCERYWCAPQDLPSELADECSDPRDALDCSLYPEEMLIDGEYWYFESCGCGQCDTRKYGMDEYTNKEAYDLLHELWDKYHLKSIDSETAEKVEQLEEMLVEIDEEAWIADYIRRNF